MPNKDCKPTRMYKGDRLEDIYFGTSESESSEDSAYRCRISTMRIKSKAVPLTRRQAKAQKTARPQTAHTANDNDSMETSGRAVRSTTRRRSSGTLAVANSASNEDMTVPISDVPESIKRRRRSAPKPEKSEEVAKTPIAKLKSSSRNENTTVGEQRSEPAVDPLLYHLRDSILLYNYLSLPGGSTVSNMRPVYRPYLKRNLRFYGKCNKARKSLREVIAELHKRVDPNGEEFADLKNDSEQGHRQQTSCGENKEDKKVPKIPFTLMVYGIRNRMLAGDREATVELFLTKEIDGTFQQIKQLGASAFAFSMAVNKDVQTKTVPLTEEISLDIPYDASKINYYLVIKVTFSDESSISSGGRSLRKIPVRQSALHLRANDLRLTSSPNKSRIESNELIMYGACLITSVTGQHHTQPKTTTRNGIVLLEANRINANCKTWQSDDDIVARIVKLAKKLHTNPFLLAEFVENDEIAEIERAVVESVKTEKKGMQQSADEAKEMETGVEYIERTKDVQFQFPDKIAYRFNAISNKQCAPLQNAFKKQKHESDTEIANNIRNDEFQSLSLATVADVLLGSSPETLSFSKNLNDLLSPAGRSTARNVIPKSIKNKQSDSVAFGNQGVPFPQPDASKVVTRVVQPSNCCIFCKQHFPDMFALLMHLRTGYPRLDFVYRGRVDESVACVDIFVNEHFDGDKDTAGFEFPSDYVKKLPQTPPTFIVSRFDRLEAKSLERSLSIFETPSGKGKRLHERRRPISFNPISLHPYYDVPLNSTVKRLDHPWRIESMLRRLHDFTDLTEGEKEFMGLWNIFCLNMEVKPMGNHCFYAACRRFLVKCGTELLEKDLEIEWMAHLVYFKSHGFIDDDESYDLISRYFNADYDAETDSLHFICRDREQRRQEAEERRKRFEEAEKKRLKESNLSGGIKKDSRRPVMATRAKKTTVSGSRDSSIVEREERSSVESSLIGKKVNRNVREADYSRYLQKY